MKRQEKNKYQAPAVIDYGTIEELTKNAGAANSDSPAGTPNTAYPPIS